MVACLAERQQSCGRLYHRHQLSHGRDIGGNAGCNYYGAAYTINGSDFSIAERHIDKTDFDCDVPEVIMRQEAAYFEALTNAAVYRAVDNRLEIDDASGTTTLVFFLKEPPPIDPALDGTEWVLISLNGNGLIAGSHITLGFAEVHNSVGSRAATAMVASTQQRTRAS